MKIALISSAVFGVPPPSYGGLEVVVYDLAVELHRRGHEVVVFAPRGSRLPQGIELVETVEPQRLARENWLAKEGEAYGKVKEYLSDFLGDEALVNDHTWFYHSALYKMEHPELKLCKTIHGEMGWNPQQFHKHLLSKVPYPCLLGLSNDHSTQTSLRLGVPVRTAYNPVDLKRYPFQAERGERFLWLSRFTPIKGAHLALDLARKLHLPLDLAGGTGFVEDQAYPTRIYEECDGHQIRWIGDVSHEEKVKLYQQAKALLFLPQPPFREPFGLVPVEANACGCPVIALRNGALPELIRDGFNGYICDSMGEVEQVIRKGLIDEIKPENCRRAAERFSVKRAVDRYLLIYRDVLNNIEW